MGVFIGLVIAHILYLVLRYWAKSSSITTPITLIAPYLMYIAAEQFHWSGVLAVVSGGLFLSFRSKDYLNYHTRMQTREVWETVGFLLNGFVFILIGLELPVIVSGLGGYSLQEAIYYALMITGMVIAIRIVLVYLMDFIPRWFSPTIRARENSPGTKLPFIIGWAGMRGVVSLASALAVPLVLDNGEEFPHRNLILFITFVVILVTLVFQGLTLPVILRIMKVSEVDDVRSPEEQIEEIRLQLARQSMSYLHKKYSKQEEDNDGVKRIKEQIERNIALAEQVMADEISKEKLGSDRGLYKKVMLELIDVRRRGLHAIGEEKKYDDEVIRDIEYNLDLEEARLNRI
jgi:CPA1 family monovalent cation:H+ antiporter